jgi:hypothetical protein
MTDGDKSAEGFLERWSRKKSEAQDAAPPDKVDEPPVAPDTAKPKTETSEPPAFDLSQLPSLDSITAATDVRAFLQPGVPAELTRAALRRAWTADPAIRDFIGIAENQWDFNDPNGVPGFGSFAPGEEIKKLIAQVFGDAEEPVRVAENTPQEVELQENSASQASVSEEPPAEATAPVQQDNVVHRNNIAASQHPISEAEPDRPTIVRKHGRALPQ